MDPATKYRIRALKRAQVRRFHPETPSDSEVESEEEAWGPVREKYLRNDVLQLFGLTDT